MNRRPPIDRRPADNAEKNSFSAPYHSAARGNNQIRSAIDESLSGVRFNAQDMRTVLRAARRSEGRERAPVRKKRSSIRPDLIFAFSLVLMVALPLALFASRSGDIRTTTIAASPGQATDAPSATAVPNEDIVSAPPTAAPAQELTYGIGESAAIRIARECFEAQCDTTIFTFDEYEVSVALTEGDDAQYVVTMDSIYQNGCRFTVILSADSGDVLQYSTPRLATVPAFLNSESDEVRAWYEKYGAYLFTWPQDVQAEFSRRYEGGTLRAAKDTEISYDLAKESVAKGTGAFFPYCYPVLYSERASSDGRAYYVVYCYEQEVTDVLPEGEPLTVTFDAETGEILSVDNNPYENLTAEEANAAPAQ